MPIGGIPGIVAAVAGLLVWAAHFGFVYIFNATACERGFAERPLLGFPLVQGAVLGATLVALIALAGIGWRAARSLNRSLIRPEIDGEADFIPWLSSCVAWLAALAIIWVGLTALFLHPCA